MQDCWRVVFILPFLNTLLHLLSSCVYYFELVEVFHTKKKQECRAPLCVPSDGGGRAAVRTPTCKAGCLAVDYLWGKKDHVWPVD